MDHLGIKYSFEIVDSQFEVKVQRDVTTNSRRFARPNAVVMTYPLDWHAAEGSDGWHEVGLFILADYFGDMEKAQKMADGFHALRHYQENGFTITSEDITSFEREWRAANQKST